MAVATVDELSGWIAAINHSLEFLFGAEAAKMHGSASYVCINLRVGVQARSTRFDVS